MDSSSSMEPSQATPLEVQPNTSVEVGVTPVAGFADSPPILPEERKERSVAVADDDIQILFSVPRRRKKKRKRLDSSRGSFATQATRNPENESLSSKAASLPEFKQYGAAYPHIQLHHTEGGLPASASFVTFETPLNHQNNSSHSIGYRSPFPGTQGSQLHAFSSPTSWWEPSPARSHSNPLRNTDWRSPHDEDLTCRKRRHQADWEMPKPQRFQYRQSMQISPRSNPIPTFTPLASSPYGMSINSHDLYGRPNHTLLPPSSWPSFDWNVFNDANTNQFISHSLQQAGMGTESRQEGGTNSGTNSPQHQYQSEMSQAHAVPTKPWGEGELQPTTEIETSRSPIRCPPAIELSPQTCYSQAFTTAHAHSDSTIQPRVQTNSHKEQRLNSDSLHSRKITPIQPEARQRMVECPRPLQRDIHTTHPSDIARKPSLYRIPPWPAPPLPSVSATTSADGKQRPDSSKIPRTLSSKAIVNPAEIQPGAQAKTQARSPSISTPAKSLGVSSTQNDNPIPKSDADFQLPKPRAGRKTSPNLIVDIAETCQELFPFGVVAERHKVPLKKVFDTFSAIIQLPLLRNADDRRRHGSLGKRRMKEYRDAKKAMERAREAERKAQMKAMRQREDASKRGKTLEKGNGLLKAAVLNNARDQNQCDGVGAGFS